jgi:hypothetical protein
MPRRAPLALPPRPGAPVGARGYDRRMGNRYRFTAELWEWESRANWFFVTLPAEVGAEIQELPMPPRGFGSVPVRARIGSSAFDTSIFPSEGSYVLPVKRAVRLREGLELGDAAAVELEVVG